MFDVPETRSRLERQIRVRTDRQVRDLAVEVVAEAVTLRGVARSYYVKQLAQHSVRDLLPLVSLRNAIVVENVHA